MLRKTEPQGIWRRNAVQSGWNTLNMGWPCAAAVLNLGHAPGFAAGCRSGAGSPSTQPPTQPGLIALFVAFAKMSLAGFGGVLVWARRGIVDQHRWMTADEFNETFALCHFLPGPNIVNLSVVFGSRFRGIRRHRGLCRAARSTRCHRDHPGGALCALWRDRRVAAHSGRRVLRGGRPAAIGGFPDDDAAGQKARSARALLLAAVFVAIGLLRLPLPAVLLVAIPLSITHQLCLAPAGDGMNSGLQPDFDAWLDLRPDVAVRGRRRQCRHPGNAPDRSRRSALDDRQAICRRVRDLAVVAGPERADCHPDRLCRRRCCRARWLQRWRCAFRRRCLPIMSAACCARSSHSRWPAIIQAALVPLSIGLMAASGLILALTSDRTWMAALVTACRGAGFCHPA